MNSEPPIADLLTGKVDGKSPFERWISTNTGESKPITAADIERALEVSRAADEIRARRIGEQAERFIASVPVHLRRHPVVTEILGFIYMDQPVHPARHRELSDSYNALVSREG